MQGSTDVAINFYDKLKLEGSSRLPEGLVNIAVYDSSGNVISICDVCGSPYASVRSYNRNKLTGIANYTVQRCKHLPEGSNVRLFVDVPKELDGH